MGSHRLALGSRAPGRRQSSGRVSLVSHSGAAEGLSQPQGTQGPTLGCRRAGRHAGRAGSKSEERTECTWPGEGGTMHMHNWPGGAGLLLAYAFWMMDRGYRGHAATAPRAVWSGLAGPASMLPAIPVTHPVGWSGAVRVAPRWGPPSSGPSGLGRAKGPAPGVGAGAAPPPLRVRPPGSSTPMAHG